LLLELNSTLFKLNIDFFVTIKNEIFFSKKVKHSDLFLKLKINASLPANKILGIDEIKKYLNKKQKAINIDENTFLINKKVF